MKRVLSRLLPRSLRAQMVLLMLGAILLVQAATFATISWSWRKFTQEVAVELTVTTLRTLRSALAQVPADERAAFVHNASGGQWRLWSRSLPTHPRLETIRRRHAKRAEQRTQKPARNDVHRILRAFVETLNQQLDEEDTRVLLSHGPAPKLYISLQGDSDLSTDPHAREWLIIPLDRLALPMGTPVLVLWLAGMGLFLTLTAGFAWHITRPITRLANAADQLAAGQPQRVIPSGPRETRVLGERFNAMLDTLAESSAVQRTLLAGLPHDLKGPLSRMWLRAEMLDDAALRDGMRKDVQDMQRMIDQFLGFVRGSDPSSYEFLPMDLRSWLSDQIEAWQTTGTLIRLHDKVGQTVPVSADRVALGRLIDNLINNALQHGQEPIDVTLESRAGEAWISLQDQGPGISEAQHNEALRPFSRLDEARTRTGSVGLGLALAEAIVHAHNGELSLESPEDAGLRVRIRLPQRDKHTPIHPDVKQNSNG